MKRVVIACQKGGVGKTTLALNLLVEAVRRGLSVAIHDADPQGSSMLLSEQRERLHGQTLPVYLSEPTGFDLVIVDTPPHANAQIPKLIRDADLVLVPMRPAVLDLVAAQTTLDVVINHGRPVAAVLMLTSPRAPEIAEAQAYLAERQISIAGLVHHRVDVSRATGQGIGISELHDKHPGAGEFAQVADFVFGKLKIN